MTTPTAVCEPELSQNEILTHLDEVLADRRFASAERNAKFLRYVVERTLEGKAHEVKETVIATEVYGRAGSYDPKTDSIVRVEASRLRQKLRTYYENEGRSATVRIHLRSGTYVPQFEQVAGPLSELEQPIPVLPQPILTVTPTEMVSSQRKVSKLPATAFVTLAVIVAGSLWLQAAKSAKGPESRDPDAIAALQEGIALLQQDPHVAHAENGAPQTVVRAIERLEFAVARDPKLARAWATLSEAYNYAFPYVGRNRAEDARRSEAAARRAIALDDNLAAGHHMLGLSLFMLKFDFANAEVAYKRALQLDPGNIYAVVEYVDLLRETGRTAEAVDEVRKARALLPALPQLAVKEAELQLQLGRPDAAFLAADSALQLDRTFLRAHTAVGMVLENKGDFQAALERYEHVLTVNPLDRRTLPAYGYLLARTGQQDKAREVAQRLEKMNSTYRNCAFQVAMVYAGLGENDLALDWLERAWNTHQVHFPFAAVEHRFRDLHQNPRFQQLLGKVGLKPVV